MSEIVCRKCGGKNFSVDFRAYLSVVVNEKREIISLDKNNIEIDWDSHSEFCYCVECGREIDFEYGDYDEDDED